MTTHPSRLTRLVLAVLIGGSSLLGALAAPTPALAARLATDEVGGVPLGESDLAEDAPDVGAASGMVLGPDGRVLWARNMSSKRAIASVTKIMTAIVVLERADLDEVVTVSEAASKVPYAVGLVAGERKTVRELLELALVASSNDAAHALAEHVGGSVAGFASLMNARASAAGLRATHFVNPHGLDADGHLSSAEDIAVLSRIALRLPEYRRIIALPSVTLPPFGTRTAARTVESTDHLLGVYDGLLGGKTGFTNDAKYCFAGVADRGGITLTTIVLGAPSSKARFDETSRLLDWGFANLTLQTVATTTETVSAVPLSQDEARSVSVRFAETTATAVFAPDGPIEREIDVVAQVDLPVFEGQPLGEVTLTQGERVLAVVGAVAAEDVASAEETVGLVPVSDYLDRTVVARASGESIDVPEYDHLVAIERTVLLDPQVDAPVAVGDRVGVITYAQGGSVILEVPVVAAEEVPAPGLIERIGIFFGRAWRWVSGRPTMAVPEPVTG